MKKKIEVVYFLTTTLDLKPSEIKSFKVDNVISNLLKYYYTYKKSVDVVKDNIFNIQTKYDKESIYFPYKIIANSMLRYIELKDKKMSRLNNLPKMRSNYSDDIKIFILNFQELLNVDVIENTPECLITSYQ
jgi:hypothetical protein